MDYPKFPICRTLPFPLRGHSKQEIKEPVIGECYRGYKFDHSQGIYVHTFTAFYDGDGLFRVSGKYYDNRNFDYLMEI